MIVTSHAHADKNHVHGPECRHDSPPKSAAPDANATHLDADCLLAYLLGHQLISSGAAIDGVRIEDCSRRNRNFRVVIREGGGLLVKQPDFSASDHSMIPFVRNEAGFLRTLLHDEALRGVGVHAPRLAFYDPDSVVLVTELIHPATSITKYHLNGGRVAFDPEGAQSCARILGQFHHAGAKAIAAGRLADLPRTPPIAYGFHDSVKQFAGRGERSAVAYQKLVHEHAPFEEARERNVKDWATHDGLVHADGRWDNYLLTHGTGHRGGLNLRLIDWELVSRGDPAYDVACWLGEYVRFRWNVAQPQGLQRVEEIDARLGFGMEAWHESAKAFWSAYTRAARIPRKQAPAFLARAMRHLPHYLLVAGWEFVSAFSRAGLDSKLPPAATWALDAAKACEADPGQTAREWFGIELEVSA